jgi:hypothetical protein
MSDPTRKGAADPKAIDVTLVCTACGFRSTLRSRRLRGANDLAPFWPHWRITDEGRWCQGGHP